MGRFPDRRAVIGGGNAHIGGRLLGRATHQGLADRVNRVAFDFDAVTGHIQTYHRRAHQYQLAGIEGVFPGNGALGHLDPAVIHAAVLGQQHVEGKAVAGEVVHLTAGQRRGRVAGIAGQGRADRLRGQRGALECAQVAGLRVVALDLRIEQGGGGQDVGQRIGTHLVRADPEQAGAFADLVGKTLAVVQAHHAPGRGHTIVGLVLVVMFGKHVHPAALHKGQRFQGAGRNGRVLAVGGAEMLHESRALRCQAAFFLVQRGLQLGFLAADGVIDQDRGGGQADAGLGQGRAGESGGNYGRQHGKTMRHQTFPMCVVAAHLYRMQESP